MSHLSEHMQIFFVPADNGILEPWRHNSVDNFEINHLFVVNSNVAKTVTLQIPSETLNTSGAIYLINRGASITLLQPTREPYICETDTVTFIEYLNLREDLKYFRMAHVTGYGYGRGDHAYFELNHFDLLPVLTPGASAARERQYLFGQLAFECDWSSNRTISLWRDGIHKIVKWTNIASGIHCLDYRIPRVEVKRWYSSGTTRMMPLDIRIDYSGVDRILWTGAVRVDYPDLFSQDDTESD